MCLLNWHVRSRRSGKYRVSILVLVDVPLESGWAHNTLSGRIVSILVLVDVPLEWTEWKIYRVLYLVSILVLVDVPLEYGKTA